MELGINVSGNDLRMALGIMSCANSFLITTNTIGSIKWANVPAAAAPPGGDIYL